LDRTRSREAHPDPDLIFVHESHFMAQVGGRCR
jgi:hypothetical protein